MATGIAGGPTVATAIDPNATPGWILKARVHRHTIPAKDLLEIGWELVQLMPPQVYQQVLADG